MLKLKLTISRVPRQVSFSYTIPRKANVGLPWQAAAHDAVLAIAAFATEFNLAGGTVDFDIAKQELLTALMLDLQVVEHTA